MLHSRITPVLLIDNGELFGLATLSSADNDNITAANFAFGTI